MKNDIITLGHGSGCGLTRRLINDVFQSSFKMPSLDDGVEIANRTVVTTDAHVISPIFYPGGDIGKLSITGTVNDVAMTGAVPKHLLVTFIIEEGFSIKDLKRIVKSMKDTCEEAGVSIIGGDTKVVPKGKADGLFITSTGIGYLPENVNLSSSKISLENDIIVNNYIGDHSIAIVNARENLELDPAPISDCAPLNSLVQTMLQNGDVNFLRDATRGGIATILNEIAEETGHGIILNEEDLPISEITHSVSEMLGLDPLYMANEGVLVGFADKAEATLIPAMKKHKYGKNSKIIGKITDEVKGVYLRTSIGGLRPLHMIESDPLPRIC